MTELEYLPQKLQNKKFCSTEKITSHSNLATQSEQEIQIFSHADRMRSQTLISHIL